MKLIIFAVAMLLSAAAQAEVYKCVENGKQVFSDQPCAKDAQKLNVKPASGHSDAEDSDTAKAKSDAFVKKTNLSVNKGILDRDISDASDAIASLQRERDNKLAALQDKKRYANNNLAGAVWEDSISNEMIAVTNSYATRIQAAERRLADLKARRAALDKS